MSRFYIRIGGENKGPYKLDQLKQQPVTESTYVWTEGMADWQQAGEVHDLKTLFHTDSSDEHSPFASDAKSSSSSSPYTSPTPHVPASPYSVDSPYASPTASSVRPSNPAGGSAGVLLGKISLAIGVLSLLVMGGAFIYTIVIVSQNGGQTDPGEAEAVAIGFSFCGGFFLSIIGLILGIIGTVIAKEQKMFGILGIILNGLPLLLFGCIMFVGIAVA
ncbi:MAG: DUF4339 domain-containing protein [Pirellulales bacterium]